MDGLRQDKESKDIKIEPWNIRTLYRARALKMFIETLDN